VIAWSWDLLAPDEQRALAWLSVFQDGFSSEGARDLLGPDGARLVEALVDQSLLTVGEHRGAVRYRMLETVREFGALRLVDAGDTADAHEALTAWAVGLATRLRPEVFGRRQIEVVDLLDTEEANLADVLRRRLLDGDAPRAVPLLASLGALWAVTGNFPRFLAMADLAEQVLVGWEPTPELTDLTVEAVALVLIHLGFLRPDGLGDLVSVMRSLPEPKEPWSRVIRGMFLGVDAVSDRRRAVLAMTSDPDRRVRAMAWQWAGILAENEGEIAQAEEYLRCALELVDDETTAWEIASLNTQASMLALHDGDQERAAEHARTAIPLLRLLHADEDAASMQAALALSAMRAGRLDEADRLLAEIGEVPAKDITAGLVTAQVRAELALVRGDVAGGLAAFDHSLAGAWQGHVGELSTNGLEPWNLIALATDLVAHVRYAETAGQRTRADELAVQLSDLLEKFPAVPDASVDYPITGMALAALGTWLLARDDSERVEPAVRLVALAHGFGYNRWFPVMDWEALAARADAAAPGRLAAVLEEYGDRRGRELRPEAERVLASALAGGPGGGVTSSG
jgi:tetratricopeptide (TPR) repeat protein